MTSDRTGAIDTVRRLATAAVLAMRGSIFAGGSR
jgi:hypothetical protein